jgi:hypothetical protein
VASASVDSDAIGITPTTLSSGTPQPKMAFIPGENPDAWMQGSQDQPVPSSTATSALTNPATISSLIGGVQLDLAKDVLAGASGVAPQNTSDAAGMVSRDPTAQGSPPSPTIDDNQRSVSGVIKPNGS